MRSFTLSISSVSNTSRHETKYYNDKARLVSDTRDEVSASSTTGNGRWVLIMLEDWN